MKQYRRKSTAVSAVRFGEQSDAKAGGELYEWLRKLGIAKGDLLLIPTFKNDDARVLFKSSVQENWHEVPLGSWVLLIPGAHRFEVVDNTAFEATYEEVAP